MLVLRCTIKAFKKIGGVPRRVEVSMARPTFGEWCVNTVDFINRGDLLLACMHVESLYVLFVPIGPEATGEQLVAGLQSRLLARLIELETPPDAAQRVLDTYRGAAVLAKTKNRSVLGHMNTALWDMECMLDIPDLQLHEGNKLLGPRIEHRLNDTPRGLTGRNVTWPLTSFWESVRKLCPELPARATVDLMRPHDKDALRRMGELLHDNLPDRLAVKMHASFQDVDALYSAEELHALAEALDHRPALSEGPLSEEAPWLRRQVHVKLERLLGKRA